MLKCTPAFSIRKPSYGRPREECGKIINMSRPYILKCTKIAVCHPKKQNVQHSLNRFPYCRV